MTDTDKLKRLAEAALKHMTAETITDYHASEAAWREFEVASTNPKAILALISENERLSGALKTANDGFEKYERLWYLAKDERDEAVALLREWDRVGTDGTGGSNLEDSTEAFLVRIDGNHQPASDAIPSQSRL